MSGVSVLTLLNLLLRHRVSILVGLVVGALLGGISAYLSPPEYTASARFIADAEGSDLGRLTGMAAQLGIAPPVSGRVHSPEFYAELLQTRGMFARAAAAEYVIGAPNEEREVTLVAHWGEAQDGAGGVEPLQLALDRLAEAVEVSTNMRTGTVTLETTAETPGLATQLNRTLLELLNEYNLRQRQSRAREERAFIAERMEEVQAQLLRVEESAEQFLSQNPRYADSPRLTYEFARIQRELTRHQHVYTTLAQSFEQARIAEIRDTPVIDVIESPDLSVRRTDRGWIALGVLGGFAGTVLMVGIAIIMEWFGRQTRGNPSEYAELKLLARGRRRVEVTRGP